MIDPPTTPCPKHMLESCPNCRFINTAGKGPEWLLLAPAYSDTLADQCRAFLTMKNGPYKEHKLQCSKTSGHYDSINKNWHQNFRYGQTTASVTWRDDSNNAGYFEINHPRVVPPPVPAASTVASVDAINPQHYRSHPSGVECIQIAEHMNFTLGNAVKYIWRAGLKSDNPIEDLQKARWYVEREIERLDKESKK